MEIEELKNRIAYKVYAKLTDGGLSCDDLLKLAQTVSELERNDIYKAMVSTGMSVFGGVEKKEDANLEEYK